MSKHKIVFTDVIRDEITLTPKADLINNVIMLAIDEDGNDYGYQDIALDKATAIKLTRVLKAEISKIQ